jgi:hypothetical protein
MTYITKIPDIWQINYIYLLHPRNKYYIDEMATTGSAGQYTNKLLSLIYDCGHRNYRSSRENVSSAIFQPPQLA